MRALILYCLISTCSSTLLQFLFSIYYSGDYIVSTSLDGTWAFLDVENNGKCLRMVPSRNDNIQSAITCGKFHPDGLIIATSTVHDFTVETDEQGGRLSSLRLSANTWNSLNLWDIRSQINVASFADHTNLITGFCFSENGYYLASGSNDKNARIFDLRKLKCLKTIESKHIEHICICIHAFIHSCIWRQI